MRAVLDDLLQLLKLERIEDRIFRGESRDLGGARVFGGQVLGQALTAASYTVEARQVHSLHAYFLVAGDVNAPIVYEVDVARDGKSFSNRRVVAIQHGQPIFVMARPDGPQGRVNYAFPANNVVQVIDTLSNLVMHTLEPGRAVLHMEFTPRGEAGWISARDDHRVVVYDTRSLTRLASLSAENPSGLALCQVMDVQRGDELALRILPNLHTYPSGSVF